MTSILRRFFRLLTAAFVLLLCGCGCALADGLDVHFLDIGRNDGILIVCDGEAAFLDGGDTPYSGRAVSYVQSQGISKLKYYVGTHAHNDHVGGAADIIVAFSPDAVLQPHDGVRKTLYNRAPTLQLKNAVKDDNYVTVHAGETYMVGGAKLTILGPSTIRPFNNPKDTLENFNSLVIRVTYGERSFLLTADAYTSTQLEIEAASPGALRCDVVKNSHHNGEIGKDLQALYQAKYVVFSTSDKYLPPHSAMRLYTQEGTLPLVTATKWNGHVVFHTDGKSLTYTTVNGPKSVSIKQDSVSIYEGKTVSLKASTKPDVYAGGLMYTSSNPRVATVEPTGKVYGVGPGTAVIRAESTNGLYAECTVKVFPVSVSLNKSEITVKDGSTASLRASIQPSGTRGVNVTWVSDNPKVATVSGGKVTGVTPGTATIRAKLDNGQQASCSVTVLPVAVSGVSISPGSVSFTLGDQKQLTAKVSPKNATNPAVVWSSSDSSIVAVNSKTGLIQAVGVGKTKITAAADGKSRSINVTVKPVYVKKITVSAKSASLVAGVSGRNATSVSYAIEPKDATIQNVTFRSSNTHVLTVDEKGNVTAVGAGSANVYVTATGGSGKRGSVRVTVGENQFTRAKPLTEPGKLTYSAKRIRFYRDSFELTVYCDNRTTERALIKPDGVLTLVLPDGKLQPLCTLRPDTKTVSRNNSATFVVNLAADQFARFKSVDLSRCDLIIQ